MESPSSGLYHLKVTRDSSTDPAIKGIQSNSSGVAIQSDGKLQVNGDANVTGTLKTDSIHGSSGNTVQVATVDHGVVELGDGTYTDSAVKVNGTLRCERFIDTIGSGILSVGQGAGGCAYNHTTSLQLGRSDINTHVLGPLLAEDHVSVNGTLDLDADGTGAAMDVSNANEASTATAINATGRIALQAHGYIALDSGKALTLDGSTGQNYLMYSSANSRIEFYIGGTLRFVIDSTGGHNP
jgi:hypothetical protein